MKPRAIELMEGIIMEGRDALFVAKCKKVATFLQSCAKCETAEDFSDSQFGAMCTAVC